MEMWCTCLVCSLCCLLLRCPCWTRVIARMTPKVEVGLLIVIWLGWLVGSIFTCCCGVELVVEAVVAGVDVGFVVKVGLVGG